MGSRIFIAFDLTYTFPVCNLILILHNSFFSPSRCSTIQILFSLYAIQVILFVLFFFILWRTVVSYIQCFLFYYFYVFFFHFTFCIFVSVGFSVCLLNLYIEKREKKNNSFQDVLKCASGFSSLRVFILFFPFVVSFWFWFH